jgi:Na+-driven multidrug efflux pump
MITPWEIYWLTRMDYVSGFFISMTVIAFIFSIGAAIGWGANSDCSSRTDDREALRAKILKGYFFKTFLVAVIFFIFFILIPNTKEMAAIILIPKAVNAAVSNKALTELPKNVLDLANEWLKELKPKTEEK